MVKKQPLITDLIGEKTTKTNEKIVFFGAVDELSAHIMELTHFIDDVKLQMELKKIVGLLSTMMGEVAGGFCHIGEKHVDELIEFIDVYKKNTDQFNGFVLPGTTLLGAKFHIVRTIARRAELSYATVYEKYGGSDYIFEYLNKLSTLFYFIALTYDKV